ncbi:MAG TPA: TlpA disulfide reductase family protein [Candidatus Limnocylindrales bacterium]|nr:TlpA disulfide reductase family protein [Candidatus Limnocylindrales bacterium]
MKTAFAILAGLLVGVLVAAGILAAFVFAGPDPVGLRPTPAPTLVPPSVAPSPSPSAAIASAGPSASAAASSGPGGSPAGSAVPGAAFHIGQPAPALVVPRVGGGTIDLASLRGKAVWLNVMQTTCPECVDEFPLMNGFSARYSDKGLVVIAIDIHEDEGTVASFATRLKAVFPLGLDSDGKAQQTWGTYALPIHFRIDTDGIVRAGALGGVGPDVFVASLQKILPGVKVTP